MNKLLHLGNNFRFSILAALLLLSSFTVKGQINITIYPTLQDTSLSVRAYVQSTYAVDTVRASVNDRSTRLPSDGGSTTYFKGSINLAGLPDGNYTLKVYVRDVLGNTKTQSVTISYKPKPIVTVIYPADNTAYSTQMRVKASVSDMGVSAMEGRIVTEFGTFKFVNSIDTVLNIPSSLTDGKRVIKVFAKDSDKQVTTVNRTVFYNNSPYLTEVFKGDGEIVDFNGTKALFKISGDEAKPTFKIVNVADNTSDTIKFNKYTDLTKILASKLTTTGAAFVLTFDDYQRDSLYIWKNNQLYNITKTTGTKATETISVSGDYVAWVDFTAGNSKLYLTNVADLSNTFIDDEIDQFGFESRPGFDISADGEIVYTVARNIYKYNIATGIKQQITTDGKENRFPVVDNGKIVYLKRAPSGEVIHYTDGIVDQALTDPYSSIPDNAYQIVNGYTAYVNSTETSRQVWLRKMDGTLKQLSFFSTGSVLDKLGNESQVLFKNDNKRYYADSVFAFKSVSTGEGYTYFVNNNLYLSTGNALYKYQFETAVPSPAIASFSPSSAARGDTVMITGSNFSNAKSVTFGGVNAAAFKVISNTSILAVVGTGATGSITVRDNYNTATKTGFTFLAAPVISAITPLTAGLGDTVTITGSNFNNVTLVSFGDTNAASYTVVSSTQIKAKLGNGSSGTVRVIAEGGLAVKSDFNFKVPTPKILSESASFSFVTGSGVVLYANTGPGYKYEWVRVGTGSSIITGATGYKYTATQAGTYRVSIVTNSFVTTSAGATVTEAFNLPADNFTVTTTDESCKTNNDGSIKIQAAQSLNYTLLVNKTGGGTDSYNFTSAYELQNLPAGTYNFCIKVAGKADWQQCFTAVVKQPQDLSVYSTVNDVNHTVTLAFAGASLYHVQLNGVNYTTSKSELTLALLKGDNTLSVTTDKLCQGIITRHINAGYDITLFPNPVEDVLNITLGKDAAKVAIVEVRTLNGALVYNNRLNNQYGNIQVNLSHLKSGLHVLKLILGNSSEVFKIIKK